MVTAVSNTAQKRFRRPRNLEAPLELKKRGFIDMTPYQQHLAEQASKEMDSAKLLVLVIELCHAMDTEIEDKPRLRIGCQSDLGQQGDVCPLPPGAAFPENLTGEVKGC
jgi:hypothetical protein